MNGAAPAVYLLIAVGMWEAFRFLRERFFRKSEISSGIVMGAAVSCLLLGSGDKHLPYLFPSVGNPARAPQSV